MDRGAGRCGEVRGDMPKPKRPPWFKMFLRHKALFEALSDEDAGVAIKAVMDYFESGQIARDVSPAVNVLVCAIKPDIDECADIYATRCENGKLGGRPKRSVRNREEPYGFAGNHMEPCRTEERREKKEERSNMAATPPHPRFIPPTIEEVKAYCTARGNTVDAERFLDFYSANGWKQGRGKPIVDWKAAVRTWERQNNAGQAVPPPRQYDAVTDTWR